uniref:Uncharacterized protein n=1 Tax=Sphaerodactylus townsendi TaxID=933632 RepID=A0ACB8E687_9SAUR
MIQHNCFAKILLLNRLRRRQIRKNRLARDLHHSRRASLKHSCIDCQLHLTAGSPDLTSDFWTHQACKVKRRGPRSRRCTKILQVRNTPSGLAPQQQLPAKLTIIFKSFQECVDQKVYQAEMDVLPAAFIDGSQNGGDKHGANSLKIAEKVPGQHIEIQAKYIGTTIVVRQVGRYLTFAARMPEEVVNAVEDRDNQGLYLCLRGCPLNQQIDFEAFQSTTQASESHPRPKGQAFTHNTATAKCREKLPVEDVYFKSCVFDLLTTGDVNFTLAAYYAFEDVKMLHSNKDKLHLYGQSRNMASFHQPTPLFILLAVLVWLS